MKISKYYNWNIEPSFIQEVANKFGLNKNVAELIVARGYKTEEKIK